MHVRDPREATAEPDRMLAQRASVNVYMGYGSTKFGRPKGAIVVRPTTGPRHELRLRRAGRRGVGEPTEKFHACAR